MYKVVLINKKTGEVSGDIGTYDDLEDANWQANDYNRKGDRHIGHAVVQAEIGNEQQEHHHRGIRLNRNPQMARTSNMGMKLKQSLPQRFSRPVVEHNDEYDEQSEEEISSEYDEITEEETSSEEQETQRPPMWHQPMKEQPIQKKEFALLIDTYRGNAIVLEKNRFLNNFLLANPTYTIQNTGEIHNMILERNQYLKSRKR
jgi:hypothetical protein